jgi:hypothetical protein
LLIVALAGLTLALVASDGLAQYNSQYFPYRGTRGPTPPISPYLNLLRGNNAAVNYYLGVVPEFQRRALYQQLLLGPERQQLLTPGPEDIFPTLAGTGHPAVFQNYANYYDFSGLPAVQPPPQYFPKRR